MLRNGLALADAATHSHLSAAESMSQESKSPRESAAGAELSHVDPDGAARMVDVGDKKPTSRRARARCVVRMLSATRDLIASDSHPKGSVLGVARIAGIQAAKRTADLIPLCHPLPLDHVQIEFSWLADEGEGNQDARLQIEAETSVVARTGVEMEAFTAATVAALTVYDMVKAVDRGASIEHAHVVEKSGGRSGIWRRDAGSRTDRVDGKSR